MLAALIRFSLRFPGVVITLAATLLGYGGFELSRAGLDIFPEFAPKQVIIQTEAPGFSPEQVEILVTQPIEQAIGGLIGLQSVRSESIPGLSIVTAVFAEDTDIHRNRQMIGERLASMTTRLPESVGTPLAVPLSSSSATVLTLGLSSSARTLMQLRTLVDWSIVPRLLAVPGVADVNVFGGEVKQLQIQVNPESLRRYGLSMIDVATAVRRTTSNAGGGFLENQNQRIILQVSGQPATPADWKHIVLARQHGVNVNLGDVATLSPAPEPPIGAAAIMGKPGIVMMVIARHGANTLTVSRAVEKAVREFQTLLDAQDIAFHPRLFRPADYIETSVKNLSGHLLAGSIFVLLVIYAFLFNVRTALICALAIPLSLLSAVLVLLQTGANLNIMVLGGLAIALGEVVDDAIIDTENIFRRLRENRCLARPLPTREVVFRASMEVRTSVVYASFIVALVFVPLLTLSGVAGRLFAPLGYSYILAILMSLAVALTLTPALCYLWLRHGAQRRGDPPLIQWLKPRYGRILQGVAGRPGLAIFGTLLACSLGAAILPRLGSRFLPELREGHYIVHTASIPGTSLQESLRLGTDLTRALLHISGVESVSQWSGRAERGADTFGSHYSEYEVRLKPLSGREQQVVLRQLRALLSSFPGIVFEANTFLTERIDETISGYTAPVVVNLFGNDFDTLDAKAEAVAEILKSVSGAADVQIRSVPGAPMLNLRLRLDRLAVHGLRPNDVIDTVQLAFEGQALGKIHEGNRAFDVAVILEPGQRRQPWNVARVPLRTADGDIVELRQVAELQQIEGRYNVLHQGGQRLQTVTANIVGRDFDDFLEELKTRVHRSVDFGADCYLEFTGAAVEQAEARQTLVLHSLLACIGVMVLVYIALGSLRHSLLTLVNLPFSLLGGVLAVLLTGGLVSVGSVVGFITLFGITVRNTIMLITHYRHLMQNEGQPWGLDTAVRGAQERLASILMTALVTALAMLPIAVDSDNPGREIMGPMAAIIIGGLISSTALNLLVLPALLTRYGRFQAGRE